MKKIYVLRHGQTLFNRQGRIQGWCDSPLTELGIEQAKKVKDYFAEQAIQFDSIYSSPSERAYDTMALATGRSDIHLDKGLKELNFGEYEGMPEFLHPDKAFFLTVPDHYKQFGGEGRDELGERLFNTIKGIADADIGNSILIGSHGAASSAFAAKV